MELSKVTTVTVPGLFEHQKSSWGFFDSMNRGLDLSDPGTGKTRVQIEMFAKRRRAGGGCALVLCPKSIMWSAWACDIKRFAPYLKHSIANAKNREEKFLFLADIYITNHDAVKWLANQKAGFFEKFDTLIIDEITAYKHHTSERSKALAKIKKYFKYRYGLTGTPASNGLTDLWHQVMVLDDGQALGRSFFAYRSAVCKPVQSGPAAEHVKWVDREGADAAVYGLLKHMTVRHKLEDCVDIPENHLYVVPYHLSQAQERVYRRLEEESVIRISNHQVVDAVHAASLVTKLLQTASGAVYDTEGRPALVDRGRYELILDLAEQAPHSLVFFHWEHQRDELIRAAEARNLSWCLIDGTTTDVERNRAVQEFQDGMHRIMFAHPQSAGHGLTLTKGTRTIWAGPLYNLEHFMQGNRRIYRAGQNQKTETIVVISPGTIDEKVWQRLQGKEETQMSLLDLLTSLQEKSHEET